MFDNINFDVVVAVLILTICIVGMAYCVINSLLNARKQAKSQQGELEQNFEPQIFEYNATVVEKYCYAKSYGVKMPQTVEEYYVVFDVSGLGKKSFSVLQQDYFQITENQTGTLALVNDKFYGFCANDKL